MLQNCRSVNNKSIQIHELIIHNNFDIVFLNETWLRDDTFNGTVIYDLLPDNYSIISESRRDRTGGGVACIYKNKYIVNKINVSFTPSSFEIIRFNIATQHAKSVNLVCIYRPSGLSKPTFIREFQDFLSLLVTETSDFIIVGDFNISFLDLHDTYTCALRDLLDDMSISQYVKKPTHQDGNLLDYVCTNSSSFNINNVTVVQNKISDHFSVYFDFDLNHKINFSRPVILRSRRIKNVNSSLISNDISNINTDSIISNKSINQFAKDLNLNLASIVDHHAPMKINKIPRMSQPWMSENILTARRYRRKCEKIVRFNNSSDNKKAYKDAVKNVTDLVFQSKRNYYQSIIRSNGTMNTRNLFTNFGKLISNHSLTNFALKMPPANNIANYFVDKIERISSEFSIQNRETLKPPFNPPSLNYFDLTTNSEVCEIINNSNKKFSSVDPIPNSLFHACIDSLIPFIVNITNKSITECTFPECYKTACVIPTPKVKPTSSSSDIIDLTNLRPISNLSYFGKTIERIVASRLNNHFTRHNLLSKHQSAYRKFHSTETALVHVTDSILSDLDRGLVVILVLLDLSAAFDCINHDLLMNTLNEWFGIDKSALLWIKSYLCERSFYVQSSDERSRVFNLNCGVPQGSVLGPILFIAYTTPLSHIIYPVSHHLYADDTQIWASYDPNSSESKDDAIHKLNSALSKIHQWMSSNYLKLNPTKTKVIQLSRASTPVEPIILNINGVNIISSSDVSNLGVNFDPHLSLRSHISRMCRTGFLWLRQIRLASKYLPIDSKIQLVHAFVTPRIDTNNALYINLPFKDIRRLQRLQNTAARLITNSNRFASVTNILHELHWLPVRKRILFKIALLTHQAINGTAPQYISHLITINNTDYTTRQVSAPRLYVPVARSRRLGDRAFTFAAPTIWNALPSDLRSNTNYKSFKMHLKTFLFSN